MPFYEYVCQACHTKYEKFIRSQRQEITLECPSCGSSEAKKAFSAFSTGRSGSSTSPAGPAPACGPVG